MYTVLIRDYTDELNDRIFIRTKKISDNLSDLYTSVCMHMNVCVYACLYMLVCMYAYIYVCMYVLYVYVCALASTLASNRFVDNLLRT